MKRFLVVQCLLPVLFLFISGLTGYTSIVVSAKTTPQPADLILRRTTQEGRDVIGSPRTTAVVGHHLPQPHRKLFWGWVFLADLIHCPPFGKKHDDCENGSWSGGSSSSSSNGGSSSSGGDDDSGGGGDVDSDNLESKSGGSSVTTGNNTNETILVGNSMKAVRLAMFIAAGMAIGLAIGAVLLGQRRMRGKHSLSGSVARRMVLFGHLCTSQNFRCDRPPRHTTLSMDDYEMMPESPQPLPSSPPRSANV